VTTSLCHLTASEAEDRAGPGLRWGGLRPAPARSFKGEFPPRLWTLPGIALGWISVVSRALCEGLLVRACASEIRTGRWHSLIAPKARPLQPVVPAICEWLVAVMRDDLERLDVARPA